MKKLLLFIGVLFAAGTLFSVNYVLVATLSSKDQITVPQFEQNAFYPTETPQYPRSEGQAPTPSLK